MKVRTHAKRQAIVAAAVQLFQEFGYERASMNELVNRLGGSKATVYGYFPSKDALFAEVVRAVAIPHFSDAALKLRNAVQNNVDMRTALTRFGIGTLQVLANDRNALSVYRVVIAEAGRSDLGRTFLEAGIDESLKILSEQLGILAARGELRISDPDTSALQLTALITAEVNPRLFQRAPAKIGKTAIRRMVERAIDIFLFGSASKPRSER